MWTVLNNYDDWKSHQNKTLEGTQASIANLQWSNGPAEFPCLVSTMIKDKRAYSAFVYRADALQLPGLIPTAPSKPATTQDQFNRWVAAQMLTVVKYLVDTGICKQEAFEESLLESLEVVDNARNGNSTRKLTASQLALVTSTKPDKV